MTKATDSRTDSRNRFLAQMGYHTQQAKIILDKVTNLIKCPFKRKFSLWMFCLYFRATLVCVYSFSFSAAARQSVTTAYNN